jgi:hypothetical protein
MICPSCNAPIAGGVAECPSCGVIVAKFKERRRPAGWPGGVPPPKSTTASWMPLAAAAGVFVALLAVLWFLALRPRVRALQATKSGVPPIVAAGKMRRELKPVAAKHKPFDFAYFLPASPLGAASNGDEIVIGNRGDPWGVLRLRPATGGFSAEVVPIIEPRNDQRINLVALAWNGSRYAGITTGGWFGESGDVFTLHDPKTLAIVSHYPAPPLVGCLAWDGVSYWAATRRHVEDGPEESLLYRLDANFDVLSTSPAPGAGCQGLAWDGQYLWYGDVFDDAVSVISVGGDAPRVVRKEPLDLSYLSGIVVFQGGVWIADYGDDVLQRIEPSTRLAWTAPAGAAPVAASMVTAFTPAQGPILAARDTNSFADRKPDDAEILDLGVELHDGAVFGSWRVWFGADLFTRRESHLLPQFARYRVSVAMPGGGTVEQEFDATAGENAMRDVRLADAAMPGEYRVHLFIHAQYVMAGGQAQILNRSGSSLTLRR